MASGEVSTAIAGLGEKTLALTSSVDKLGVQVKRQEDRLEGTKQYGRRNRKMIYALAVSFGLDILLTAIIGLTLGAVHRTADQAKAATTAAKVAQNNLKAACEGANRANAATLGLFERLAAAGPKPATPEAAAKQAQALADIRTTYAPQNC